MKKIFIVLLTLLPFVGFSQVKLFTTDASKEYPNGTRITYFTISDCPDDSDFLEYANKYVSQNDGIIRFHISKDYEKCFYEAQRNITETMIVDYINEAYFDYYNGEKLDQKSIDENSNSQRAFKKADYNGTYYRVAFKLEDTPNIENVKRATIVLKEKGNFEAIDINDNIHFEISSAEPISADFVTKIFENFGLKIEEEFMK
ncbi:MAG: hypothetical protein ACP5DZ_04010 [Bacteroidales bacterium]